MKSRGITSSIAVAIVIGIIAGAVIVGLWTSRVISPNSNSVESKTTSEYQVTAQNTSFFAPTHSVTFTAVTYSNDTQLLLSQGCIDSAGGQGEGYTFDIYAPLQVKVGDSICIQTVFVNVANQSSSLPFSMETVNVTDASGKSVFQFTCVPTEMPNGNDSFGIGKSYTCGANWDTRSPFNGTVPQTGNYQITATVRFGTGSNTNSSFVLDPQAELVLVPLTGYTRTIVCYLGYATVTQSIIVDASGSTTTIGPANPPPKPANDTTMYSGTCSDSGPIP